MFAETHTQAARGSVYTLRRSGNDILPGLLLCTALAGVAGLLQYIEVLIFGRAWLEAPVLAILVGALVSAWRTPGASFIPGIRFSTRQVLETAIVMLGAGLSAQSLMAMGPSLIAGIVAIVLLSLTATYAMSRALGLSRRMATLIACGNSICGNSAILAIAPVIGAKNEEVACSITFTAAVSVAVVILLPAAAIVFAMSEVQYGILAGLTVYAVPQVLAATAPIGAIAIEVGTMVKLGRVLMLGPICIVLSLLASRSHDGRASETEKIVRPPLHALLPWFIIGFLLMAAARSADLIPATAIPYLTEMSKVLTVISLAALGLGVDIRASVRAGPAVTGAVVTSVALLCLMSLALIAMLALG